MKLLFFVIISATLIAAAPSEGRELVFQDFDCEDITIANEPPPVFPAPFFAPQRFYLSYSEGRWIDNRRGYATVGLFAAIPCCEWMFPFFDLRYHVLNNGRQAANLGGGVRYWLCCDTILGINGFFDYRATKRHKHFQQIGGGIEILSPCVDFRLNCYAPAGSRTAHFATNHYVFDQYEATCRNKRQSNFGANLELGRWICRSPCYCFDLYGAIGGFYYFSDKHSSNDISGGEARLKAYFGRYVSLEIKGGYDSVYQGSFLATLTLDNIAFGCCSGFINWCMGLDAYQRVEREELIIFGPDECCWTWNW